MDQTSFEVRSTKDQRPTVQIWLTPLIPLISFSYQRQDPSSSSAFLGYISGVHHFLVRFFAYVTGFNPTIEVITFRLRGWCILGVFLLPAFTHQGHECQDLLSPCDGMHVCTEYTPVYNLIRKSFWRMESEPMLTPRENSLYRNFSSHENRTHDAASSRTACAAHYQRAIPAPGQDPEIGETFSLLCLQHRNHGNT